MSRTRTVIKVVLALVLVVGLIAVVGVFFALRRARQARVEGEEATAIQMLRKINVAEVVFSNSCGGGAYAPSLASLSVPAPGTGVGFVERELGHDPAVINGYTITLIPGPVVDTAPASCNGIHAGSVVSAYFVSALPSRPGQRYFATSTAQTIMRSTRAIPLNFIGDIPPGAQPIE